MILRVASDPSPANATLPVSGSAASQRISAMAIGCARPGQGAVRFANIDGKTAAVRTAATNPLKLLVPRATGTSAWVIAGSFGGGLVAGDHIRLDVQAEASTRAFVGTQSATKVYRSFGGRIAQQASSIIVGKNALLVWCPDPVCCFAEAVYEQRQRFDLDASSSLVLLDWFTSGRLARGERWSFNRYLARTDVFVAGRHLVGDHLRLDARDGPLDSPFRMGRFDCFATLVLLGPLVAQAATVMLEEIAALPVLRHTSLLISASPLDGGAIMKLAGPGSEQVGQHIRRMLAFVPELLGDDPWRRKW